MSFASPRRGAGAASRVRLSLLVLLLASSFGSRATLSAASHARPQGDAATPEDAPLAATISADETVFRSSLDGRIAVTIRNEGTEPERVNLSDLRCETLSLEVRDARGRRVPTVPPPMPLAEDEIEWATLQPGESIDLAYGLHMFSPMLPDGDYTVRMRVPRVRSNELAFTIRSGG